MADGPQVRMVAQHGRKVAGHDLEQIPERAPGLGSHDPVGDNAQDPLDRTVGP